MLSKELLLKIHQAASMQRWNDQIRTVELTELDKQAHKMIIAYILGRCEQGSGNSDLDWTEIIEAGLFEFLQRIVLTDIKPPLFHKIKQDRQKYRELNEWAYQKIEPVLSPLGEGFLARFRDYLTSRERKVNRRIISAAHFYATKWEFNIIERANPRGHDIEEIREDLESKQEKYYDLKSMQIFLSSACLRDFADICGQLRFQIRWSHLHRVPKTSVLGHMLIVAILAYLFSLELKADESRRVNNYFTALFHDLPEVLTRDIINPVKRSIEGLDRLIKDYEREEMNRKIYKLIPRAWHAEMKRYTEDEFTDLIALSGKRERDGRLLKAIDDLAAFIEVHLALTNGIKSEDLQRARDSLLEKYKRKVISGVNFGQVYSHFA